MLKTTAWNASKALCFICAIASNADSAEPARTGRLDVATKNDIVIAVQSCPDVWPKLLDLTSGPTKQRITKRLLMYLVANCEMEQVTEVKADQKPEATNAK